jgi:hypothetical protein
MWCVQQYDLSEQNLVQIGVHTPEKMPPETLPRSASDNSTTPAGFGGSAARSASVRLFRYAASFHARTIF